jgi:hypothetical protein
MSHAESENEADDSNAGSSIRAILFVVVSVALAIACVALALQYFVAERLPALNQAALEAAVERWDQNTPPNYDMDILLRGAQPGKVHVEVRGGEVTAETRDGRDPGRSTWGTWAVPGMFDTLERDLQIAANPQQEIQAAPGTSWRLRGEFDPRFGYPVRYHRFVSGGPEVYWQVTSFQPK